MTLRALRFKEKKGRKLQRALQVNSSAAEWQGGWGGLNPAQASARVAKHPAPGPLGGRGAFLLELGAPAAGRAGTAHAHLVAEA